MALKHPQKRSIETLERLVKASNKERSSAELSEWLRRGWNPFLQQEGASRHRQVGVELMMEENWGRWLADESVRLMPLAAEAFGRANKVEADELGVRLLRRAVKRHGAYDGVNMVALCVDQWKVEPDVINPKCDWGAPALFNATPWAAKELLARGANPKKKSKEGQGLWECWAWRQINGEIVLNDLDEIALVDPPIKPGIGRNQTRLGEFAVLCRAGGVAMRMSKAGAGADDFGVESSEDLSRVLLRVAQADSTELFEAVGLSCGWDRVMPAMLWSKKSKISSSNAHLKAESVSAMDLVLGKGCVGILGVLERSGTMNLAACEASMESAWKWWTFESKHDSGRGPFSSAAWIWARTPSSQESQERAVAFFAAHGDIGSVSRPLASVLASRGWLPDSGAGSLREVFKNGDYWDSKIESFEEFEAVCEAKALRLVVKPKKNKPGAEKRKLLRV